MNYFIMKKGVIMKEFINLEKRIKFMLKDL